MTDDKTAGLGLPLLAEGQAQKHVTVNEALLMLDGLVHLSVLETRSHPPSSPQDGDRYLVAWPASGDWSGREGAIAQADGAGWRLHSPRAGWLAHDAGAGAMRLFDGADWRALGEALGHSTATGRLGVGTAPLDGTALVVAGNESLFTAPETGEGNARLTLNRRSGADLAALQFKTAFDIGAEAALGPAGFEIKTAGVDGLIAAVRISPSQDVAIGAADPVSRLDVRGALRVGDGQMLDAITLGDPHASLGSGTGVYLVRRDATMTEAGSTLHIGGFNGLHLHAGDTPGSPISPRLSVNLNEAVTAVDLRPAVDNAVDLGSADLRFAQIYAATSVITTSDARDKVDVEPAALGLAFVEQLRPVSFRFAEGGQENGAPRPGRRRHYGLIAQDVEALLKTTDTDFGGFVRGPDGRLGLRYEQLVPVLIQAVTQLSQQVRALQEKDRLVASTRAAGSRKKNADQPAGAAPNSAPQPRRRKGTPDV